MIKDINTTGDYSIVNIVSQFKKNFKNKNDAFSLLLKLKQSLEFNASIDWKKLFHALGDVYNDHRPLYNNAQYTNEDIKKEQFTELDVLVFGSNTQGEHLGGVAKLAVEEFGAIMGQPRGLQGQSYGIVTIDYTGEELVNLHTINKEIDKFISYALDNSHMNFWVTKIGTGISGYPISEIASLFNDKIIPSNVILPKEFTEPHLYENYFYSESLNRYFHIKNERCIISVDIDTLSINTLKVENARNALTFDVIAISEEDFVIATEGVLKKMF